MSDIDGMERSLSSQLLRAAREGDCELVRRLLTTGIRRPTDKVRCQFNSKPLQMIPSIVWQYIVAFSLYEWFL